MEKSILYFEGHSGASGDMILGVLVDLGFSIDALNDGMSTLPVKIGAIKQDVTRAGMRAKLVVPELPEINEDTWTLSHFLRMIDQSSFSASAKTKASGIFTRFAEAEGKVHQKDPDKLHFHELGGWDTILDILGGVAGFEFLNLSEVYVGPLNIGGGEIRSQHGVLPCPPPAVSELVKGFSIYSSGFDKELLTPTGAVMLTTLGTPVAGIPSMTLERVGHGAGKNDFPFPNILRGFLGKSTQHGLQDVVLKLETNIDDMNPQFWDQVFDALYAAGALEVFVTPVVMKKGRPAHLLTVLTPLHEEENIVNTIFRETTTLGVRREVVSRLLLERRIVEIQTSFGMIQCKVGEKNGEVLNLAPEYESLKALAKKHGLPLKELYRKVLKELPC